MAVSLDTSPAAVGAFTAEAFAAHLQRLASTPDWWRARKQAAYETFVAHPLPRRTDEAWRFSNLGGLRLDGFQTGKAPGAAASVPAPFGPSALRFVNNVARPHEPAPETGERGIIVAPLSEALVRHADLLREHFMSQEQKLGSEKFAALHTAFVNDGAFIYVPPGIEVSAPLVITHAASGPGAAVFPHTLVLLGDGARATVVDHFVSLDQGAHFACGANDLHAGHGAQLTYVAAQEWSRDTLSLQFNATVVRRDTRVQSLNVHLGGRQSRHESLSLLQAPGGSSEMLAVTVADSTQEFDQRTLQIHQAPDTKSDLLYKNALRDRSRTIFSGLIVVDADAQRTDAYQSNRNLMLSEDAEASALPGLEIHANDVRCTHGATSSRIDPEHEFYLQSRGLTREAADELLIFGFFEAVLDRLTDDALYEALRGLIRKQFGRKPPEAGHRLSVAG